MKPIVLDGLTTLGNEEAWAVFSPCERYRYLLGRTWDAEKSTLRVTMMNPSRATHTATDKTIDKVTLFSKAEGFGGFVVDNLGAWRSTDPAELLVCADPVGPRNVDVLRMPIDGVIARVAAWGRLPPPIVRRLSTPIWHMRGLCTHVFAWTETEPKVGRHPLFLKNASRMIAIEREATS